MARRKLHYKDPIPQGRFPTEEEVIEAAQVVADEIRDELISVSELYDYLWERGVGQQEFADVLERMDKNNQLTLKISNSAGEKLNTKSKGFDPYFWGLEIRGYIYGLIIPAPDWSTAEPRWTSRWID